MNQEARFKVVTLCGSTKFKNSFERVNVELTRAGRVVLSVGVFEHADGITLTEKEKANLDLLHLQKIDMADEIFVINEGGYIGTSTQREIAYATSQGIPVVYLEPLPAVGSDGIGGWKNGTVPCV